MIAVIDYKAGNLTSVVKALRYLGAADVVVTQDPSEVLAADKVVLPGVGHLQATQLLTTVLSLFAPGIVQVSVRDWTTGKYYEISRPDRAAATLAHLLPPAPRA